MIKPRNIYFLVMNLLRYPLLKLKHNNYSVTTTLLEQADTFLGCNIGRHVYVGKFTLVSFTDIGPYTCISSNVFIGGMDHSYWYYSINPKLNPHVVCGKRTTIGHDVWIGANVVVRQGVTIGDGAVIGAGSVVTHDIPANSVSYGSPARVVKQRFDAVTWERIQASRYWEHDPKCAKKLLAELERRAAG